MCKSSRTTQFVVLRSLIEHNMLLDFFLVKIVFDRITPPSDLKKLWPEGFFPLNFKYFKESFKGTKYAINHIATLLVSIWVFKTSTSVTRELFEYSWVSQNYSSKSY